MGVDFITPEEHFHSLASTLPKGDVYKAMIGPTYLSAFFLTEVRLAVSCVFGFHPTPRVCKPWLRQAAKANKFRPGATLLPIELCQSQLVAACSSSSRLFSRWTNYHRAPKSGICESADHPVR